MPLIQFKTITQQAFELDVDEADTIAQVKEKIAENKGAKDFPVDSQKLIFNGKVLEDAQKVPEVAQGKFIVVMVMKKPAAKAGTSSSAAATAPESKEGSKEGTPSAASTDKKPPSPAAAPAPAPLSAEQTQIIDNIAAMGYPREEVVRACQAAFFNADRAVEYLCTGIPAGLNLNQAAEGSDEGEEGDETDLASNLAFLANSPQFQQLREMVRADPSTLPQIVQQIAETNPQLMELIRNQQDDFLQLLNAEPAGQAAAAGGGAAHPAAGGVAPAAGGAAAAPQRIAIPITPDDRAAIDRLMAMGFPEPLVIEAYLACDKNEGLAVNYILQRMEEMQ